MEAERKHGGERESGGETHTLSVRSLPQKANTQGSGFPAHGRYLEGVDFPCEDFDSPSSASPEVPPRASGAKGNFEMR